MPFKEHYRHIPSHIYDDVEGPYPGNAGYQCYPSITQSMGQCSGPSPEKRWWPEVLHRPQKA